jgi:5'-3' exonuclease
MDVHLIDGTYELFRQFFGQKGHLPPSEPGDDVAATVGVLNTVLATIEQGGTHVAVATDHRIESFRNEIWPGYKTSAGVDPALLAQFPVLEASLEAFGICVLAMDELEADDGLASAASVAIEDAAVDRVLIWTPDKDLAQCVRGDRVLQMDRRNSAILDERAVVEKYGVLPESIPDYLALVGDSADGFPGLRGWGRQSASAVLAAYRHLESIPPDEKDWHPQLRSRVRSANTLAGRLRDEMELALLFRDLATLRIDPGLVPPVAALAWSGPGERYRDVASYMRAPKLAQRAEDLAARRAS